MRGQCSTHTRPRCRGLGALSFISFCLSGLPAWADTTAEEAAARWQSAVVGIAVKVEDNTPPPATASRQDDAPTPAILFNQRGHATGGGLLVSDDGLVLSVASLFELAGSITVTLAGGERRPAKLVGLDRHSGLALLRLTPGALPAHARLMEGIGPRLGEGLVAMGRTVLEDESFPVVTQGIASTALGAGPMRAAFIQSTAGLLPGMGGGPLISLRTGEIVGINSSVYSNRNSGFAMAFAIPIAEFQKIRADLLAYGRVVRSTIGIAAATLAATDRAAFGLGVEQGVIITNVRDSSAAARAGLRRGDIVLVADGETMDRSDDLFRAIQGKRPGVPIQLELLRSGTRTTLEIQREESRAP